MRDDKKQEEAYRLGYKSYSTAVKSKTFKNKLILKKLAEEMKRDKPVDIINKT